MDPIKESRRGRTFTGCWTCRARKVKCDELVPECSPCQRSQLACAGYDSRLVWVMPDQKTYQPQRRRFLNCESTWEGVSPLTSDQLNHLISLSSAAEYVKSTGVQWDPETNIPFHAFPLNENVPPLLQTDLMSHIPRSLRYSCHLKNEDDFIFQHYTKHVAVMMMPYEDQRNPWATSYSQAAYNHDTEEQRALCSGLLAQAATNLAHLGCSKEKMQMKAEGHYTRALQLLKNGIGKQSGDFESYLAAAMTLMMFEVYNGGDTWRTHLNGAWRYLQEQPSPAPWEGSEFAWASTQSLCLIKILSDTSRKPELGSYKKQNRAMNGLDDFHLATIKARDDFGFTIGAPRDVLNCISDITNLAHQLESQTAQFIDKKVEVMLSRLGECREMNKATHLVHPNIGENAIAFNKRSRVEYHHVNAFISATYIYLYRSIYNLPPLDIRPYVADALLNIRDFFSLGDGNLSLWPGFIAAVEVYDESDMRLARSLLDIAMGVGMGNRLRIRAVVEEVWRLRDLISREAKKERGSVAVDWSDVMQWLGLDLLLV